jgi:hypothetical protein
MYSDQTQDMAVCGEPVVIILFNVPNSPQLPANLRLGQSRKPSPGARRTSRAAASPIGTDDIFTLPLPPASVFTFVHRRPPSIPSRQWNPLGSGNKLPAVTGNHI